MRIHCVLLVVLDLCLVVTFGQVKLNYGWYNRARGRPRPSPLRPAVFLSGSAPFVVVQNKNPAVRPKRLVESRPRGRPRPRLPNQNQFRASPLIFGNEANHFTTPITNPTPEEASLLNSQIRDQHDVSENFGNDLDYYDYHETVSGYGAPPPPSQSDFPAISGFGNEEYRDIKYPDRPRDFPSVADRVKLNPQGLRSGGFHNYVIHHKRHLAPDEGHDHFEIGNRDRGRRQGDAIASPKHFPTFEHDHKYLQNTLPAIENVANEFEYEHGPPPKKYKPEPVYHHPEPPISYHKPEVEYYERPHQDYKPPEPELYHEEPHFHYSPHNEYQPPKPSIMSGYKPPISHYSPFSSSSKKGNLKNS